MKAKVDADTCIGCGLCVAKCPTKAAKLVHKKKETVPPRNIALLYLRILQKKAGNKKMMLNMVKMLVGQPL